jgi:choline dehydrogenase
VPRGRLAGGSSSINGTYFVRHHYLTRDADVRRLREGVRVAVELLESGPMRALVHHRTGPPDTALASASALDAWMRTKLTSAIHLSCSCRMGPDPDEGAVVDQYCRVYGVAGLRVVDTSVLPYITSRGTAATALMLGERAADFF